MGRDELLIPEPDLAGNLQNLEKKVHATIAALLDANQSETRNEKRLVEELNECLCAHETLRMRRGIVIPGELKAVRDAARKAIGAIRPADDCTEADAKFLFNAQWTNASRELPAYYLVYFLLVDLLGFRNLGRFEKLDWSVPIDFNGKAFLIEHRKRGVGVFAHDACREEDQACKIVTLIKMGVKAAQPFFEWLAKRAIQASNVNVINMSFPLFERFTFFFGAYQKSHGEAIARKDEQHIEKKDFPSGTATIYHRPALELNRQAGWLALAAIDAFFSWSEHVFIHIAILAGKITSAIQVAELAEADWQAKFKRALDLDDPTTKSLYDKLVVIRRQLRNFVAHGAFGKQGEAFRFHSSAGAVPVLLPHPAGTLRFAMTGELSFDDATALGVIDEFICQMWSGTRAPAKIYIQKAALPAILTMALDGTYAKAMSSVEAMDKFVDHLAGRFDEAANMDW